MYIVCFHLTLYWFTSWKSLLELTLQLVLISTICAVNFSVTAHRLSAPPPQPPRHRQNQTKRTPRQSWPTDHNVTEQTTVEYNHSCNHFTGRMHRTYTGNRAVLIAPPILLTSSIHSKSGVFFLSFPFFPFLPPPYARGQNRSTVSKACRTERPRTFYNLGLLFLFLSS